MLANRRLLPRDCWLFSTTPISPSPCPESGERRCTASLIPRSFGTLSLFSILTLVTSSISQSEVSTSILLGATTVDAKLRRTADAMRRLAHALTGDYGFIELAPNPPAHSKESLTHCEIRVRGSVRGVVEARSKDVLDALVEEVKRLTEGGKRDILLSDLEGSSQAGAQSLLGNVWLASSSSQLG